MTLNRFKGFFLKTLLACLIAAALVAIVSVLAGQFNDIAAKALLTIMLVAVHCLVSFSFIVNNEKQDTFDSLAFFTIATFVLIVLSFVTSILGVWNVFSGDTVFKLYLVYFVLLFATLHTEMISKMRGRQASIDNVSIANYAFIAIVVAMLVPVIFTFDSDNALGSFYYRLLSAAAIVDATLTLTAVILHKLYLRNHPELNQDVLSLVPGETAHQAAASKRHGTNIFVLLFIGYIAFQLLGGFVFLILNLISGH